MTAPERHEDGRRCYDAAMSELRQRYLAERLPGEGAQDWVRRVYPGSRMLNER